MSHKVWLVVLSMEGTGAMKEFSVVCESEIYKTEKPYEDEGYL